LAPLAAARMASASPAAFFAAASAASHRVRSFSSAAVA